MKNQKKKNEFKRERHAAAPEERGKRETYQCVGRPTSQKKKWGVNKKTRGGRGGERF